MNLTYSWTAPTGGWIADQFDMRAAFFTARVQLVTILLLPLCDERSAEARFREFDVPTRDRAGSGIASADAALER